MRRTHCAPRGNLSPFLFHYQVEALLASEDYGKDLASVNNLLKKHQLLEADISAHEVIRVGWPGSVRDLKPRSQILWPRGHFIPCTIIKGP